MKHKGLKDESERIAECKEQLYNAIEDNVDYFRNYRDNHLVANPHVYYSIPMSHFEPYYGLTLDKFIEIKESVRCKVEFLYKEKYCITTIVGNLRKVFIGEIIKAVTRMNHLR